MLRIGKANQYFTLWSVNTETKYNSNKQPYEVTHFVFMGNLSRDLKLAQQKAQSRGCKDLTPDESLRGQTRWETSGEKWEPEVFPPDCFQFGKYRGKSIKEMIVNDCKENPEAWSEFQTYLKWYFQELQYDDQKELLKAFDEFPVLEMSKSLLELIDLVIVERKGSEPYYVESEFKTYLDLMDKINDGKIAVYTLSNFSAGDYVQSISSKHWEIRIQPHGASDEENEAFFKYNSYGKKICVHCPDTEMKMRYYNGFHYWVPSGLRTFKKSIMRIKLNEDEFGSYRVTHIVTPQMEKTTL